jgi:hypothetical protein
MASAECDFLNGMVPWLLLPCLEHVSDEKLE